MEPSNIDSGPPEEPFAFSDTPVSTADTADQYSLPHAKAIDLIGEEFVPRLKTEPDDPPDGESGVSSTGPGMIF